MSPAGPSFAGASVASGSALASGSFSSSFFVASLSFFVASGSALASGSSGSWASSEVRPHMHIAVRTPSCCAPYTMQCAQPSGQQNAIPPACAAPGRPWHALPISQPLAFTFGISLISSASFGFSVGFSVVFGVASSLQTQVAVRTSPLCDVDAEQSAQPSRQQTVTPLDCAASGRPLQTSPWSQPWTKTVFGGTVLMGLKCIGFHVMGLSSFSFLKCVGSSSPDCV
mmetsp:Transcript_10996/g.29369  ORF Transcript_10996/g.29369 Transcript_10996/m.29369 type:complete len:227 (-) Transcript_10996:335-1015(-)